MNDTDIAKGSDAFYPVVIDDGERHKIWRNCRDRVDAEREVKMLKRHGFDAKILEVGKE